MKTIATLFTVVATIAAPVVIAHPGHEAEDFFHAIAHELMTWRGIFSALAIGAGLFFAVKWLRGRR
jgi:predicted transporter